MTKAPTPTEKSKKQRDNTKNTNFLTIPICCCKTYMEKDQILQYLTCHTCKISCLLLAGGRGVPIAICVRKLIEGNKRNAKVQLRDCLTKVFAIYRH